MVSDGPEDGGKQENGTSDPALAPQVVSTSELNSAAAGVRAQSAGQSGEDQNLKSNQVHYTQSDKENSDFGAVDRWA
jgi:hypothetical protein